ncbi:MAG TPA: hypothetical protein VNR86_10530 [Sphingomicrobium sp.]|nr:hypothetical protein [Sphingomicrobium sp.]
MTSGYMRALDVQQDPATAQREALLEAVHILGVATSFVDRALSNEGGPALSSEDTHCLMRVKAEIEHAMALARAQLR